MPTRDSLGLVNSFPMDETALLMLSYSIDAVTRTHQGCYWNLSAVKALLALQHLVRMARAMVYHLATCNMVICHCVNAIESEAVRVLVTDCRQLHRQAHLHCRCYILLDPSSFILHHILSPKL